jgi:hypothetical protein
MNRVLQTCRLWLPGYCRARVHNWTPADAKRVWLTFADHFEPWWHQPDEDIALERVRRWTRLWPKVAERHSDSAGRPACYTFFYPEEQYHPKVLDELAKLREMGMADVEVHLHHDNDSEQHFLDSMSAFIRCLHHRHGLLQEEAGQIRFGFIHGNWALDNSLPGGRFCGLDNEITLLRKLGCYADFTLPAAPSPAQARMVNTIYWANDDPLRPRSHDKGVPLVPGGPQGDLLMIPGPLAINVREWRSRHVPKLDIGEVAGHAWPSPHRARLWVRNAPRIGDDIFVKLFAHGAPEKNGVPLLEGGGLDRTLAFMRNEASRRGMQLLFVSARQMWTALEAIRLRQDPAAAVASGRARYASNLS